MYKFLLFFCIIFLLQSCLVRKQGSSSYNNSETDISNTSDKMEFNGEKIEPDDEGADEVYEKQKLIDFSNVPYDDSGDGIQGRKVTFIPTKELGKIMIKSGRIEIKTCIDPMGKVVYTELNTKNTTITDDDILYNALEDVAKKYEFEPDPKAAQYECGKLIFIIDINYNFK